VFNRVGTKRKKRHPRTNLEHGKKGQLKRKKGGEKKTLNYKLKSWTWERLQDLIGALWQEGALLLQKKGHIEGNNWKNYETDFARART